METLMKNRHVSWFGLALILLGALLLLERMDVIYLRWSVLLWAGVAVVGLRFLLRGFRQSRRGRVFWGTQFLLFGTYQVAGSIGLIGQHWYYLAPALLMFIGAGFLMMYLTETRSWHLLVPAAAAGGFGFTLLLAEFGVLARWEVTDAVKDYWPIALILFGLLMLLSQVSRNRNSQHTGNLPGHMV